MEFHSIVLVRPLLNLFDLTDKYLQPHKNTIQYFEKFFKIQEVVETHRNSLLLILQNE